MDKEFSQIQALDSKDIVVAKSGIGKVNAAVAAVRMIEEHKPDCIISTGCAGGLAPGLDVMDVIVGSQTGFHDVDCGAPCAPGQVQGLPARFEADKALLAAAMALTPAEGSKIVSGFICTGDVFCTQKSQTDAILAKFPDAAAVDMESAAIAQVCHLYNKPFLSFRILSDTTGTDNSERIAEYKNFWSELAERSFEIFRQFALSIL